jgi:hypothetical protein
MLVRPAPPLVNNQPLLYSMGYPVQKTHPQIVLDTNGSR